jgi:hypothetical protein
MDNMLVAHGREAVIDPRRIAVATAEMHDPTPLRQHGRTR